MDTQNPELSPLEREIEALLQAADTDSPSFCKKADFIFEHCEKKLIAVLATRKNSQQKIVYLLSYGFAFIAFSILHGMSFIHMDGKHPYLIVYILYINILYACNIVYIAIQGFHTEKIGLPGIDPENICDRVFLNNRLPTIKLSLLIDYQEKININASYDNQLKQVIAKATWYYIYITFPPTVLYYFYQWIAAYRKRLGS